MIAARVQTIELIVQHQGQPCQRMPETCGDRAESPANALERDSGLNVTVLRDIDRIINIDKAALMHEPKRRKRCGKQNDVNQRSPILETKIQFYGLCQFHLQEPISDIGYGSYRSSFQKTELWFQTLIYRDPVLLHCNG